MCCSTAAARAGASGQSAASGARSTARRGNDGTAAAAADATRAVAAVARAAVQSFGFVVLSRTTAVPFSFTRAPCAPWVQQSGIRDRHTHGGRHGHARGADCFLPALLLEP